MTLEAWDGSSKLSFDHDLWADITTLRFMDDGHNVVVMGPVGVGKTFMAISTTARPRTSTTWSSNATSSRRP
jgi:DNA replication protein DnaC